MYAIFVKGREFKDLEYYIGLTQIYAFLGEYFSGVNIIQWQIFFRSEYFLGLIFPFEFRTVEHCLVFNF